MARSCELCGKQAGVGNRVSHANNKTRRRWRPNLQNVRALVNGGVQHVRVCTRCLRSGKIVKAPPRGTVSKTSTAVTAG